jgi:NodT family efflux transporter outer membrane factor (OMF) lipoprotein
VINHIPALLWYFFATILLMLSGCASKAIMVVPTIEQPAEWSIPVLPAPSGKSSPWWDQFSDANLSRIMRQAFESNADLLASAHRVKRSQLQSRLVDANGRIGLGGSASVTRNQEIGSGSAANSNVASALLSYEVDLWGKLAQQRDISQWQSQASKSDCESLALSLSGTLTNLYWQIALLNQLITMGESDIDYATKTLEIVERRFDAGAVSGIARSQAATNLSSQKAAQARLVQNLVELRHAMAALLSKPPDYRIEELPQLPETRLPMVRANLPAEVLKARPDLRAAELRLRAAFLQVDVVRTSFFPSLSLTGGLGTASTDLQNFVKNPVGFLGGILLLPFIHADTVELNIQVTRFEYEEATAVFRQRLYTALTEVEDALSAKQQLQIAYDQERIAKEQAALVEGRLETQYRTGFVGLQSWLDASRSMRGAERALSHTRLNQLMNESRLYLALGAETGMPASACEAR